MRGRMALETWLVWGLLPGVLACLLPSLRKPEPRGSLAGLAASLHTGVLTAFPLFAVSVFLLAGASSAEPVLIPGSFPLLGAGPKTFAENSRPLLNISAPSRLFDHLCVCRKGVVRKASRGCAVVASIVCVACGEVADGVCVFSFPSF